MVGQIISHYKIIEKLGGGGMGVVYKALDTKLNRPVALKFIPSHLEADNEEKQRFITEARAASALDHLNIGVIYEIDETADSQMFIAMAFYEGETLKKKVSSKQLSVNSVIDIAMQIAQGLAKAHEHGIIHRDIKPANVMITKDGIAKIVDFGVAKFIGESRLTKTGSTLGTTAYMSPEQARGEEVDARADIWSLGVVMYEMLTGELPFKGEYDAAIVYAILNQLHQPISRLRSDVPVELENLINKCLEKQPADRYQHADEVIVDLRRLKKESTKDKPVELAHSAQHETRIFQTRLRSKKKIWLVSGSVAILTIIAAVVLLLTPRRTEINPNMTFRILPTPFTDIGYPGLSHDGNWVAFPTADPNSRWDVYLMNTSSGEPRRITSVSSFAIISADISPDGSQIAYSSYNSTTGKGEVNTVSSLGGSSKKIVNDGAPARWRPDGQRIGYILGFSGEGFSSSKSGKLEFWSIKPDGSDNRLEFVDQAGTTEGLFSFSWSPDGKSVAWLRTFPERYQEIIVHELATGKERQLTFDQKNIDEVCWARGDEIIFSSDRMGNQNLWIVPASGGQAVQITKGSGPDLGIQISADRKKLLYFQNQFVSHLWTANTDGNGARQITFDDRQVSSPSLSPDDKSLLFIMRDPAKYYGSTVSSHLYITNRVDNNRQQLTFGNELNDSPVWSPDGQWIAFSSRPIAEPVDSTNIYLLPASKSTERKLLGKGLRAWWVDSKKLIVFTLSQSWLYSTDGTAPQKFFEDSTWAYPILKEKYVLFRDFHKARDGWWIVPVAGLNGPATGQPRKIPVEGSIVAVAPSGEFLLNVKNDSEIWKISLPNGQEQRLQENQLKGFKFSLSVNYDGKEMVLAERSFRGKLVMIENPFK